jgi:hypothetical protein
MQEKYRIGVDCNGNHFAETYNEEYKMWVRITFSPVGDDEAVQSALRILKQDYLEKLLE